MVMIVLSWNEKTLFDMIDCCQIVLLSMFLYCCDLSLRYTIEPIVILMLIACVHLIFIYLPNENRNHSLMYLSKIVLFNNY